MSSPTKVPSNGSSKVNQDPNPPTVASFSPNRNTSATRQRSTIQVQQKSPLLVATPPQITRALAFSHPFLLPLNKFVGLITWSSGDPWESFLLVAVFCAVVLYGDFVVRWAGPMVVVIGLILGMYSRRYSPLSSTGWTGEKSKGHKKQQSEGNMRHQKSLDEILDTLNIFTSRCNILLDPFLQLTDFLSTQRTATSATTRPALTSLLLRILIVTPIWIILAVPPIRIITTQRVVLTIGTLMLSWHSRPARVSRTILWRSLTLRNIISALTGLVFTNAPLLPPRKGAPPPLPPRNNDQHDIANSLASSSKTLSAGVRFTFVVYENQRRWLGLGWTSSLFAYERAAWTDEHLNPSPSKADFQLPVVNNENAEWRWVSEWCVDGAGRRGSGASGKQASDPWIYYDNKVRYEKKMSQMYLTFSIVERWTSRPRWMGSLYTPSEMVSRCRASRGGFRSSCHPSRTPRN